MAVYDSYIAVGRRIKQRRRQHGMSQTALAGRLGMSQSSISNFEAARRRPSIDTFRKIAGLLCVPVGILLGGQPADNPEPGGHTVDSRRPILTHRMPIRRDLIVALELPADLTQAEASRVTAFVNSLVFEPADLDPDIEE